MLWIACMNPEGITCSSPGFMVFLCLSGLTTKCLPGVSENTWDLGFWAVLETSGRWGLLEMDWMHFAPWEGCALGAGGGYDSLDAECLPSLCWSLSGPAPGGALGGGGGPAGMDWSLRCAAEGTFCPVPLLSLCFWPPWGQQFHSPFTMLFGLTTSPETTQSMTMDWTLWSHEPNTSFFF